MNKPLPAGVTADMLVDLHETAAEWFVRQQAADWNESDRSALEDWLQDNPLHREIFDSMGHTRQLLSLLKTDLDRGSREAEATASKTVPAPGFWRRRPDAPAARRALMPTLAAIGAVLIGGGWYVRDNTASYRLDIATAAGETRSVDLPDGTRVALNFGSSLQVRYYPRRREAVLNRGEGFFQVAADTGRPFTVDSGDSRITVLGTSFNVQASPPRLVVRVKAGEVQVKPDRATRGKPVLLSAGHGIAVDSATARYVSESVQADTVGDWRSGQIRFKRASLEDVAQQLARYLGRPIALASADLATLPVSGYFSTAAPEAFLQLLPGIAPVQVQRAQNGDWLISGR
ncbi:MAG: FecR domain-containing protein [Burkholderiaceae bacterium]